jgi:hypothetical protein
MHYPYGRDELFVITIYNKVPITKPKPMYNQKYMQWEILFINSAGIA